MAIHHPQLLQRRDFRISPQEGPGDACGRKNARFLGAKSEIKTDVSEDGLQKGAPRNRGGGHDGRQDRRDLLRARRDQQDHLAGVLIGFGSTNLFTSEAFN